MIRLRSHSDSWQEQLAISDVISSKAVYTRALKQKDEGRKPSTRQQLDDDSLRFSLRLKQQL